MTVNCRCVLITEVEPQFDKTKFFSTKSLIHTFIQIIHKIKLKTLKTNSLINMEINCLDMSCNNQIKSGKTELHELVKTAIKHWLVVGFKKKKTSVSSLYHTNHILLVMNTKVRNKLNVCLMIY